jgi:adenosylhomocysteine nucleosidase
MRCGGPWIGFGLTDMSKVAIVAALQREVRPLIKHWRVSVREHAGRRFRFFENGDVVLVCAGIGTEAARRAAEAVLALYLPRLVYSVGYAGALEDAMQVGELITPARVINADDGSSALIAGGEGILLSHAVVATVAQKARLRESYGAQAVDMEASGVARAAEARGVLFAAVKVISDEFDFELPATERFVDTEGRFHEARFALFVALRPWLWWRVVQLARNSARASRALCAKLQKILAEEVAAGDSAQLQGADKKLL